MTKQAWGVEGHWNPISHPVYISLVARATLSRHNGKPILESYNNHYGYWATHRDLSKAEVIKYLGDGYVGNM